MTDPVNATEAMAFVSSSLDRCDALRRKPDALEKMRADPRARLVRVSGDQIGAVENKLVLKMEPARDDQIFLGVDGDHTPWFSCKAQEGEALAGLRGLMLGGNHSPEVLSILAQARSLTHWHETHGFCAKCGRASQMMDGGYRRHCHSCNTEHFPRTDPVVIMAVTHGERVLLGRQSSWPAGMYSALAGFMEPGETIEQAARREVFEESGIRVGDVRYVRSQPWPFPSSLMIGLVGEALDDRIEIDGAELEDARWFSFSEARQMQAGQHPQGYSASHPYAIAYHLVKAVVGG